MSLREVEGEEGETPRHETEEVCRSQTLQCFRLKALGGKEWAE